VDRTHACVALLSCVVRYRVLGPSDALAICGLVHVDGRALRLKSEILNRLIPVMVAMLQPRESLLDPLCRSVFH